MFGPCDDMLHSSKNFNFNSQFLKENMIRNLETDHGNKNETKCFVSKNLDFEGKILSYFIINKTKTFFNIFGIQ